MIFGVLRWSHSCLTGPKSDFRPRTTRGLIPYAGGQVSHPERVCSSDVTVRANQRQRNSGRGPHLLKKALGQLKEHTGFLVSRSLTLHPTSRSRYSMIFLVPKKKTSLIRLSWSQHTGTPHTGSTICQKRGHRSNEIPWI